MKRGFRALRSASQGSALRTRGLLKKAGENFSVGCGAGLRLDKSFLFAYTKPIIAYHPQ